MTAWRHRLWIPAAAIWALSSACWGGGLENGSFTAELNGFNIHYEIHGRGPVTMVVPNSWGLTIAGLRGLFGALEQDLTLVYFDPRGMGGSDPVREPEDMGPDAVRADFDALRSHLGLESVNAIGWSNGAYNLVLLAAEHPQTIDAAVFVHGGASFLPEDSATMMERAPEFFAAAGALQPEMAALGEASTAERNAFARRFFVEVMFPHMVADPARRSSVIEVFADAEFSFDHSQYTQQVWQSFDARDRLESITAHGLVIAGRHDMLPPERVRELHDGLRDSRWVVFESSGHFAPIEEPDKFQAVVLEFLGP